MPEDLYQVLGVDRSADLVAVRRAYRRASKKAHPDGGGSEQVFALVKLAADVLSDPGRRERYDKTGVAEPTEPDNAEPRIWNRITGAVMRAAGAAQQRGLCFADSDLVAGAKACLADDRSKLLAQIRDNALAAASWRKAAKRVIKKGDGPNRIAALMVSMADGVDEGARQARRQVEEIDAALKVIAEYGTNLSPSIPQWCGQTSTTTTFFRYA